MPIIKEEIKIKKSPIIGNPTPVMIKRKNKSKYLFLGLLILVIALGATSFYFYKRSRDLKNPIAMSQKEGEKLVETVGKIALLPTDETPTIATVSDPEALRNQSFFSEAIKGDKVLIYTNAKKAYLYRPSLNKIITIAPLNIGEAAK